MSNSALRRLSLTPGPGESVLLDGRYRFDNFVVGAANRLAASAARAVAESPGMVYNPLFIYSGSGLGKTHLLTAIGHGARELVPALNVEYTILDDFVDQLTDAISTGQADAFKRRYQQVDILLLDDVQFLTGRRETQTEMLRIFNALQSRGRQIVMASDRPPNEITDVDERLLTRLSGGLIVDIGVPEFETRVAILRYKCTERGWSFAPGVLEELARMSHANVRELQGALNRLAAHQSVGKGPLAPSDIRAIVGTGRFAAPTRETQVAKEAQAARDAGPSIVLEPAEPPPRPEVRIEPWKTRLTESIARWSSQGIRTAVLERALALKKDPDVEALETVFAAATDRLRALEADAIRLDPSLGGLPVFRDPERVAEAEALVERAIAAYDPPPAPSREWTRDALELGTSNHLAVRAGDAVIEEPGSRYNPLFIHGPAGVGKTHLAHAVGNALHERFGDGTAVACVSGEQFVEDLIAAIHDDALERWRSRYRSASALIVDDVHVVGGKERSQDELFHLFNALHGSGKQIVFTSDKPPAEIPDLEARLRSRFDGGLVVAMQPADRALRQALYLRYLTAARAHPDPALANYLADYLPGSAAEAQRLVRRLAAAAAAGGAKLTLDFAHRALEAAHPQTARPTAAVVPALDVFFLDSEKVVRDWPDIVGRAIEEFR